VSRRSAPENTRDDQVIGRSGCAHPNSKVEFPLRPQVDVDGWEELLLLEGIEINPAAVLPGGMVHFSRVEFWMRLEHSMMHGQHKAVQASAQSNNPGPELRKKGGCLILSVHARAKEERIVMAFSTAGGGPSRPEMNVTPLIDILLVLIIVFMVIVATSKEYVVNTQLPEEAKGEQPHQSQR
jgi:Biopolymer transport protein ExbD/TolR